MACCGAYMGRYCSGCPAYDPEVTGRQFCCGEPLPGHDEDCLWNEDE